MTDDTLNRSSGVFHNIVCRFSASELNVVGTFGLAKCWTLSPTKGEKLVDFLSNKINALLVKLIENNNGESPQIVLGHAESREMII